MFYIYAYIRSENSKTAISGTPYYIGKGSGTRAWDFHSSNISVPKNRNFIVILEDNLTEIGAFALERRYIKWYGRKDLGTGILLNRTDGGDGSAGYVMTDIQREYSSRVRLGKLKSAETKKKMSESKKGKASNILGKKMSDKARENISISAKKRKENDLLYAPKMSGIMKEYYRVNPKGKDSQAKVTCPHCNLSGGSHAMKRWHFNNCKEKI